MNKKLLLFDFDGTVIDNSQGITNCIRYSLGKMGKPVPDADTLRKFIGPSLFFGYTEYIEKNDENAEIFVAGYRERYGPIGTTEVRLYDGIAQVLDALKKDGYILAVCSGKPLAFVKKIAAFLGVDGYFEDFYCPDFATHSSDKSDMISEAARRFGVTKQQTLMIGDTLFDVRAAKTAGVECLGVDYGFGAKGEVAAEGAEYVAASVPDVYRLITGKEL